MSKCSHLLTAPLADYLIVARPGSQQGKPWLVLNPLARWIWESHQGGLSPAEMAELLAAHFRVPLDQARAEIYPLLAIWRNAGWCAQPASAAPGWALGVADQCITLTVDDPALAASLERITGHLRVESNDPADSALRLSGTADDWRLWIDGAPAAAGDSLDEAVVKTVAALVELGCRTPQRLLTLHAAGVSRAGRGWLLIGQGGVGKTTLATALNAHGWELLGDDVVPVTTDGQLLGIGLSLCLKAGSWPVVAPLVPDFDRIPRVHRAGQPVRFLPPPGAIVRGPLPTAAFLFPRYAPDTRPALEPLAPVAALQGIIAAESVIADLTQDTLTTLIHWIGSIPAFSLTYPDLDHALALIADAAG